MKALTLVTEQGNFINNPQVQTILSMLKKLKKQYSSSPVGYEIEDTRSIKELQQHLEKTIKLNNSIEEDILQTKEWKQFHHLCSYLYRMQQALNYLYIKEYHSQVLVSPLTLTIPRLCTNGPVPTQKLAEHFNTCRDTCNQYLNQTINILQQDIKQSHSELNDLDRKIKDSVWLGWTGLILTCSGMACLVAISAAVLSIPPLWPFIVCIIGGMLFTAHFQWRIAHSKEPSNLCALEQAETQYTTIIKNINTTFRSVENSCGLFSPNNSVGRTTSQQPSSSNNPIVSITPSVQRCSSC